MKRSRLLAAVLCSAMVIGSASFPVMADATKVVTLGADLNEQQRQTMMSYFKANPNEVQILYVTNQDERNHLGSYIPLSQIGTRTLSCAYVKPTQSGGIRVRTANLNYVTGNMIASSLSTSGIANCEVIAACPFEVSGTGALTGIQMAYETASGRPLDPAKKDLAAKEIVVTQNVASTCGNNNATRMINSAKLEVIQNDVQNANEIYNIVNNICIQNNINITQNNVTEVVELLEDIAAEDYAIEDVEETLINVDENVANVEAYENNDVEAVTEPAPEPEYDADSILNDIDETVLGPDVPTSSTEDPALEAETYEEKVEEGDQTSSGEENRPVDEFGIPEAEETVFNPDAEDTPAQTDGQSDSGESVEFIPADGTTDDGGEATTNDQNEDESSWDTIFGGSDSDGGSQNADEGGQAGNDTAVPAETDTTVPAEGTDTSVPAADPAQQLLSKLSAEETTRYQSAKDFCKGEFEGDKDALTRAMGAAFVPSYTFSTEDKDSAAKLSAAITDKYLSVLAAESGSYVPDGSEKYFNEELNQMNKYLKGVFGIEGASDPQSAELLKNLTADEKARVYGDCMNFFEKLYGETAAQAAPEETTEETTEAQEQPAEEYQGEESYTESYDNGAYYGEDEGYSDGGDYGEETYYGIPEGTEEVY